MESMWDCAWWQLAKTWHLPWKLLLKPNWTKTCELVISAELLITLNVHGVNTYLCLLVFTSFPVAWFLVWKVQVSLLYISTCLCVCAFHSMCVFSFHVAWNGFMQEFLYVAPRRYCGHRIQGATPRSMHHRHISISTVCSHAFCNLSRSMFLRGGTIFCSIRNHKSTSHPPIVTNYNALCMIRIHHMHLSDRRFRIPVVIRFLQHCFCISVFMCDWLF